MRAVSEGIDTNTTGATVHVASLCPRTNDNPPTGGARLVTEMREHRGDKREIPEDALRRKGLKKKNKEQEVRTLCRPVTPEVVRGSS
jgi:hypothetical protein